MKLFDDYQEACARTSAVHTMTPDMLLVSLALGVTGEGGEVADMIKKHVFHGHPLDRDKLRKELGDTLWYLGQLARAVDTPLSVIAEMNIDKLKKRYPNGFTKQDSIARVDELKYVCPGDPETERRLNAAMDGEVVRIPDLSKVHVAYPEQLPPGDGRVTQ